MNVFKSAEDEIILAKAVIIAKRIIDEYEGVPTTSDKDKESDINKQTKRVKKNDYQQIIDRWNSLGLQKLLKINSNSTRQKLLKARINDYGLENVLKAIDSIKNSSFLKGNNQRNWIITFDWFIKPNNFPKVLEGNYLDNKVNKDETRRNYKGFIAETTKVEKVDDSGLI